MRNRTRSLYEIELDRRDQQRKWERWGSNLCLAAMAIILLMFGGL